MLHLKVSLLIDLILMILINHLTKQFMMKRIVKIVIIWKVYMKFLKIFQTKNLVKSRRNLKQLSTSNNWNLNFLNLLCLLQLSNKRVSPINNNNHNNKNHSHNNNLRSYKINNNNLNQKVQLIQNNSIKNQKNNSNNKINNNNSNKIMLNNNFNMIWVIANNMNFIQN